MHTKKIASLSLEKYKARTIEKVMVIHELSQEFKLEDLLKEKRVRQSMSRKGNYLNNSLAKKFFA